MKKTEAVRGKFYGKINRAVVSEQGRVIEEIPFDQLVKQVRSKHSEQPAFVVVIDDDLREHFPTAEAVNEALRSLAGRDERDARTTGRKRHP